MHAGRIALVVIALAALEGCVSLQPANYRPRYANYSLLSEATMCKVAVRNAASAGAAADRINMRGAYLVSPVGDSFADFLAAALQEELARGRVLDAQAPRMLDLLVTRNVVDTQVGVGSAQMTATVSLSNADGVLFDGQIEARREWSSPFFGASAVERAHQQYAELLADVIYDLFSDPAFVRAMQCERTRI